MGPYHGPGWVNTNPCSTTSQLYLTHFLASVRSSVKQGESWGVLSEFIHIECLAPCLTHEYSRCHWTEGRNIRSAWEDPGEFYRGGGL